MSWRQINALIILTLTLLVSVGPLCAKFDPGSEIASREKFGPTSESVRIIGPQTPENALGNWVCVYDPVSGCPLWTMFDPLGLEASSTAMLVVGGTATVAAGVGATATAPAWGGVAAVGGLGALIMHEVLNPRQARALPMFDALKPAPKQEFKLGSLPNFSGSSSNSFKNSTDRDAQEMESWKLYLLERQTMDSGDARRRHYTRMDDVARGEYGSSSITSQRDIKNILTPEQLGELRMNPQKPIPDKDKILDHEQRYGKDFDNVPPISLQRDKHGNMRISEGTTRSWRGMVGNESIPYTVEERPDDDYSDDPKLKDSHPQ